MGAPPPLPLENVAIASSEELPSAAFVTADGLVLLPPAWPYWSSSVPVVAAPWTPATASSFVSVLLENSTLIVSLVLSAFASWQ